MDYGNTDKIDFTIHKPDREDYTDWHVWFQDYCDYLIQKYRNTYGTKD